MRSNRIRVAATIVFAAVVPLSCDSSTGNRDERITLALSQNSFTLLQGATNALAVTIERTNFEKPVTLSIQGTLPDGVTAEFALTSLPSGTSATTLTIEAAGNSALGPGSFTVRATGEGITEQTQTVSITVAVTGTYTLGLLEPSVTVAQGGGGTATVLVSRTGGNASDVSVVITGLPAGVGATLGQSPTTDRAVSLTVAATAAVAPGSYPITLTSSSPGHAPDQSVMLSVQVIAPPAVATVSVPFCSTNVPAWFAFRNEGYAWERVSPTGSAYSFAATSRVAIAFVFAAGQSSDANIYFLSRSELAAFNDLDCPGVKTNSGTVVGLTTGQSALVVMGASADLPSAAAPAYSLEELPARPLDLVATRGVVTQNAFLAPDRFIVRRGLDLATGTTIPELNFTAAEAVAPAAHTLTINGVNSGETLVIQNTLRTATGTYGTLQVASFTGATATLNAVPTDQLVASDVHEFFADAFGSNGLVGHAHVEYTHDPADKTVTLGPLLGTPAISTLAATPYARMRATLASQPEYPTVARFSYQQGTLASSRLVVALATSGYLGATPTTWDVAIPDFTGTAGFNASWMLLPGLSTPYLAEAFSGRNELLFGAAPVNGDAYRIAYRQSATSTLKRLQSRAPRRARLGMAPQYLSR
jgi:hypothetical protein